MSQDSNGGLHSSAKDTRISRLSLLNLLEPLLKGILPRPLEGALLELRQQTGVVLGVQGQLPLQGIDRAEQDGESHLERGDFGKAFL